MLVIFAAAALSDAVATPSEASATNVVPVKVSADRRTVPTLSVQNRSSSTVVGIQVLSPDLIARLDATGFAGALPWSNPAISEQSDPQQVSDSFTVRGTGAALVEEPKAPAVNWSAILATLLLIGFFLFRRV